MRYLLIILFLPLLQIYSQDDNPYVELPDFVITGQDVISIKRTEKIKPDFVSTITEKFIKPIHLPDELGLRKLSNPVTEDLNILDSSQYSHGSLEVKAGIYDLPDAKLSYSYPFKNGIFMANIGGIYQRAYVDNSDRYSFNGGVGIDYSLGIINESLQGTSFFLGGDYSSLSYKLFASDDPGKKRTNNIGNYSLGIKNVSGKKFIFDVHFNDYFTSLVEDNFSENLISTTGFGLLQLSNVGIGLITNYQKQFLNTDSLENAGSDYFFFRPTVSFELFNSVKAKVGYSFTNSGGETFNNIFASFGLRLSKNLVLTGEFAPQAEFVTSGTLLRKNDYFNSIQLDRVFYKKSNYFNAVLKYEYENYYQIDAGLRYYKSGNFIYYSDSNLSGQFDISTADANEYNVYINVLFHTGPFGVLYFNFDYFRIRDKSGNRLPYYPSLKSNFTYGYEFNDGLMGEVLVDYFSSRYTDITNTKKLNSFFNLGIKLTYKLQQTFILKLEFANLLDRDIFLWEGYKEKPFDFYLGFNLLFD